MEYVNLLENATRSSLPIQYQKFWNESLLAGNRFTKHWPLMNPFHVLLITLAYVISVPVGRAFMKNRDAFSLKGFSLLHNGFLVLLSAYMCGETLRQAVFLNFNFPFGNALIDDPKAQGLANVLWIFYFSKIPEFVDTWIMILKKNDRQISFLHVYHHSTIFPIWWCVVYYAPGGESYFSAAQNSFIHVLMYAYYFMATLKISVPYKPYITQMQMFQFFLNFLQASFIVFFSTHFPRWLGWVLFYYMISLLVLFYNFYRQNYNARKAENAKNECPKS